MKSKLKKIDIESLLNFIKVIENKTIKEKINDDVERIAINLSALDEDQLLMNRDSFFNNNYIQMEKDLDAFDFLIKRNIPLLVFIDKYKVLYDTSMSIEKQNEYIDKILGKNSKKGIINVFIEGEKSFKPIICLVNYRNDYDLNINKKYSEDETLRLIESKQIVVISNPSYKEMKSNFFCGIEDVLDLNDERVIRFTTNIYPSIYEDIRTNLTNSKIKNDMHIYKEDRTKAFNEINGYYESIRGDFLNKANQILRLQMRYSENINVLHNKPFDF
ncbi:MAG: hypothetical protein PHR55_01910 [Bacilli bacterium]|nr:hypothetical protein [Bacilli bacterium]